MPVPRLRRVEPALRRALRGPCATPAGSRVIVAVSGGADSTALLVALVSVAREFALTPIAAHLHHGVRGAEADDDAAHVAALCARLGVPLVVGRRHGGTASESRLRATRRRFLLRARAQQGAALILTAHTANDQLETLLFRLARGAGLRGMGGMAPRRGRFAKPLLEVTREALARDLAAARLAWREDAANSQPGTARNRIRHDVVPALARAVAPGSAGGVPRLAAGAARVAAELRSADRALAMLGERRRERHAAGPAVLPASAIAGPVALRRATARAFWRAAAGPGPRLLLRHIQTILDAAGPGPDRSWTMPSGWRLARCADRLHLLPPAHVEGAPKPARRAAKARVPV